MRVEVINNENVKYPYISSYATYKAYVELETYYGPYELFSKVTTYFRTTFELPSYIGKGVYNNIDYVIQRMTNHLSQNPNLSKSLFGGGKGNDYSKLYISTLGEMFERILGAFSYYRFNDKFIFGSYDDLKGEYDLYHPEEIKIFAEEQFTEAFLYDRFTVDSPVRWVQGKRLLSGEDVWVPAQLVFIYYPFDVPGEAKIGYATSGGLSLHDDRELALYHGITECMERDSINIGWYNRIAPELIDLQELQTLSRYGRSVMDHKEMIGKQAKAYYHNLDLHEYPVVTTISFDDDLKKFSFCAGGGVADSVEGAVESSFREFGQSELNLRALFYNPNWYSSKSMIKLFGFDDFDLDNMTLFYEVVPYYGIKQNRGKLDWYLNSNNKRFEGRGLEPGSTHNKFEHLLEVLEKYGIDPVVFDLTPEGFDSIRLMKSYIPELTAAFLPNAPCLGHPRFYNLAYEQGLANEPFSFAQLNTEPLPFP